MVIAVVGFVIFIMGTSPELFGLDRSPVVGFVQITVFLFGLYLCGMDSPERLPRILVCGLLLQGM